MTAGPAPVSVRAPVAPRRRGPNRGWWATALVLLIPVLIPPVSLLAQSLGGGLDTGLSAARLFELLMSTLALTLAVTVTALALGATTAWLTTMTDVVGRRFWMLLAALPLVVPSYVAALTIIGATGQAGLFATWWGLEIPTPYGFVGAWLALSIFLAPMAHLLLVPGFRRVDPSLEEAARGLGASRAKVLRTVTLPLLRPGLTAAGLMISLYTVADFGAVSLLRYDTFTRAIYTLYVGQIDRSPAILLSLVLMLIAWTILWGERRTRTRSRYFTSKPARDRQRIRLRGGRRVAALAFLTTNTVLGLVIPVAVLGFWLSRGLEAGTSVALLWEEVGRSVGVSVLAAVVAVIAAFPLAMVTSRKPGRLSGAVESMVWGTYSLPHIAVGVALVGFALTVARSLYQTVTLLVGTYVVMFLAQAMSSTQDSLLRTSPDLEDASRGLGRGQLATLTRITIPLAAPGMIAGGALVFLSAMKELPATLLLRPNGFETLAIRVWSSTGEGFYSQAAVAGLFLLAVSVIPLLAVTRRDLRD